MAAESLKGNDEQILVYHCQGLPKSQLTVCRAHLLFVPLLYWTLCSSVVCSSAVLDVMSEDASHCRAHQDMDSTGSHSLSSTPVYSAWMACSTVSYRRISETLLVEADRTFITIRVSSLGRKSSMLSGMPE